MVRPRRRNTNSVDQVVDQSVDRDFIGKLPDCVLNHILSLIPYKEAARTATLATRWHHLLPSERVVDFDERRLGFQVQGESGFVRFTKELMENYKEPCVDKFSLTLNVSSPADYTLKVRDFVTFAAEKKAKVMLFDFSKDGTQNGRPKFDLPKSFYANPSLETLQLYSCDFDPFGYKKTCTSLLNLSLAFMYVPADSLQVLIERCTSLKTLIINKCLNTQIFVIKGRALESLVIEDCDLDVDNCWIDIQTPNLKFFKYIGNFCNFEVYVTDRLEEAVFDFRSESEFGFGVHLYELFKCHFDRVKVLTICSYVLQTIHSGDEPLGIQGMGVKHLTLKASMHENEFYGIRFFLYSCSSLETLTIDVDLTRPILQDYEAPFNDDWKVGLPVYTCVRRALKVVEVKGYRGNVDECFLLNYLVSKGRVLKKLDVEFHGDLDAYVRQGQMLGAVRKASRNLQITISRAY